MQTKIKNFSFILIFIVLLLVISITSCKKLVEVDPPYTSLTGENVYTSDATAIAALNGIYIKMGARLFNSVTGANSITLFSGLSADELILWSGVSQTNVQSYYFRNALVSNAQLDFGTDHWSRLYNFIFVCNSAIDGLGKSTTLTSSVQKQLQGEARFIRAFCFLYLVNLFGDVPLITGTDYNINATMARTDKALVYQQIIVDLKEAQNLLSSSYLDGSLLQTTSERVRPTKWAATALLARAYLYTNDWAKAEAESNAVISNVSMYDTVSLNNVFIKNSKESIWQLQPINPATNTEDGLLFILPASGPNSSGFLGKPVYLNPALLNAFEANDGRKVSGNWINSVTVSGVTYFYPFKYKALQFTVTTPATPATEYLMVLRLGEQYLIRSEARAQQNNISGAQSDLNIIRKRANLPNTTVNDKTSLLTAILHERQVELFTEWGHRWLDLKRTGTIDAVMSVVTPLKANGALWQSYQQLYPIPFRTDILFNPNLIQNNGY